MKSLIKVLALLSAALLAFGDNDNNNNQNNDKVSSDLQEQYGHADEESGQTIDVIVRYKSAPTKDELKQLGPYGQIKKMYNVISGVNVSLSPQTIKQISADPNVAYVTPNRKSKGSVDISTGTVNANLVWSYGYDGTSVGVAVIDSGITVKNDFKGAAGTSRVVYSQSFVPGVTDTSDAFGHGTHVAGIIGGNGASSSGLGFSRTFKGVAPNVNIVNLRVLDQNGAAQESDVIAAIQRAIELKSTYNIRVINLSLGHRVYESYTLDPLCQAVEAAWKAGIAVVVAAGNYGRDNTFGTKGYGTIASPGNDPYVITVGATNAKGTITMADDSIASFSSKGPTLVDHIVKPDLVAPGNQVTSVLASSNCTLAASYPKTLINNSVFETLGVVSGKSADYFRLSGTSMAAPVVSGAVALLLQKDPTLTPDQLKARLMKTARKILPSYMSGTDLISNVTYMNQADVFTVGAGYLDIFAALQNNDRVTLPALSPTAVFNSASKKVTMFRAMNVVWGDNIVWGDNVVWGDMLFSGKLNGLNIVWGDSIVWGDATAGGFNVIWGTTVSSSADLQALSADDGDQG
jgi:serine protease AprX